MFGFILIHIGLIYSVTRECFSGKAGTLDRCFICVQSGLYHPLATNTAQVILTNFPVERKKLLIYFNTCVGAVTTI